MTAAITKQVVTIWNSRKARTGDASMASANALLMLPDGYHPGAGGPAAVFTHRWAGYHYDPTLLEIGEDLARRGVVVLTYSLRRSGAEGQRDIVPDDDNFDIALAVDYLSNLGHKPIYLLGEGIGALSVGRYAAASQDPRLGGLAFIRPGHAMGWSLANKIGQDHYNRSLNEAQTAMKRGMGQYHLIDVWRDLRSNPIVQTAEAWLSWWGPTSETDLSRSIQTVGVPMFVLGADAPWEKQIVAMANPNATIKADPVLDNGATSRLLAEWIQSYSPISPRPRLETETVSVLAPDGFHLAGVLWTPESADTVLLFVPDAEGTPMDTLPVQIAPDVARSGLATLAVQLRRSGRGGQLSAMPDKDVEDIQIYADLLRQQGFKRIVLCGHGIGCESVVQFQAKKRLSDVAAVVLLAPVGHGAERAVSVLGEGRYQAMVDQARTALAHGHEFQLLIDETYQETGGRPGDRAGLRFQRAGSWLTHWGPEAPDRLLNGVQALTVPALFVVGKYDDLCSESQLEQLRQAASGAPKTGVVVLDEANHRFVGVEERVAGTIGAWVKGATGAKAGAY